MSMMSFCKLFICWFLLNMSLLDREIVHLSPHWWKLFLVNADVRKIGWIDEANVLAERINLIISETHSKQLAKLSDASPKQLRASVIGEPVKLMLVRWFIPCICSMILSLSMHILQTYALICATIKLMFCVIL